MQHFDAQIPEPVNHALELIGSRPYQPLLLYLIIHPIINVELIWVVTRGMRAPKGPVTHRDWLESCGVMKFLSIASSNKSGGNKPCARMKS